MVLLSPSRTITETLTTLAASTAHQLEETWDEVGYSPEDRASQLSDLLVKFRDLCEHKIAEEKGVAETFRQTIAEAKEEIETTASALKMSIDPQILQEQPGMTLTDRLSSLESTLDELRSTAIAAKEDLKVCQDFLIESHEALGIEMEITWRDIDSDLTALRRDEFHRKKAEMKEELSTRTSAVIQLLRDCQHLHNDLRIDAGTSDSEIDRQIAGSLVRSKDGSFIMASKFKSEACTGISSCALEDLTKRVTELHGEKRRRKSHLQEMGAQIAVLWEKLRVPEEEQVAFTESVQGLGMDTIEKGENELKRLHALKSKMLDKLIEEARQNIFSLWEQINATPEQRRTFEPFYIRDRNSHNDDLLEKYEDYVATLESRLEQMKPILRIIERRELILKERAEYEELQKDPERLKQRGASMTHQLMEEEKMARRIKRDLPRLTELLTEKLHEWKENNDEDFQYHGEVYLAVMDRQEEQWNQYKAEEMHRKLKKKQEEKTFGENQFAKANPLPKQITKKSTSTLPLGDVAHKKMNVQSRVHEGSKEGQIAFHANLRPIAGRIGINR
jgi:protein regulator of cytokinesis 1